MGGADPAELHGSAHDDSQRVERSALLIIRHEDGKPRSTGDFVRPEKVPSYAC
jgi:hypothetical protein